MNLLDQLMANKAKQNLTILDVDSVLYLVGYNLKDQMTPLGLMAFKEQAIKRIYGFLDRTKADYYIGFYSSGGKDNFRRRFDTIATYKGNRTKKEEYITFFEDTFYNLLKEEFGFHDMLKMEADDALVICGKQYWNEYNVTFINMDKDHKQFSFYTNGQGFTQFNPRKYQFEKISYDEGCGFLFKQMIHGDSTDNIKGIPGQGKKSKYVKAIDALDPYSNEDAFEIVRDAYIEKFGDNASEVMAENYILLKMLSDPCLDYDPEVIVPIPYTKRIENKRKILDI